MTADEKIRNIANWTIFFSFIAIFSCTFIAPTIMSGLKSWTQMADNQINDFKTLSDASWAEMMDLREKILPKNRLRRQISPDSGNLYFVQNSRGTDSSVDYEIGRFFGDSEPGSQNQQIKNVQNFGRRIQGSSEHLGLQSPGNSEESQYTPQNAPRNFDIVDRAPPFPPPRVVVPFTAPPHTTNPLAYPDYESPDGSAAQQNQYELAPEEIPQLEEREYSGLPPTNRPPLIDGTGEQKYTSSTDYGTGSQTSESIPDTCSGACYKVECPSGPPGAPGYPGYDGEPGRNGDVGLPGMVGMDQTVVILEAACSWCPEGPPGPAGAPGPAGLPGDKGPPGHFGHNGKPNFPGPMGEKGPLGPPGEKGKPGFMGVTGADWMTGKGKPGKKGKPGVPGQKGNQGRNGEKGQYAGEPGLTGSPGIQGPPGSRGIPGRRGYNGEPGVPGNDAHYCSCPPSMKGYYESKRSRTKS